MIIGSHVSFKKDSQLLGSLNEALSYDANTFMIYTGAPQNTIRMPINDEITQLAFNKMLENNIDFNDIIVHAPYIINLASSDNNFAVDFLNEEIKRVSKLGLTKLVLHPGSHVGQGIDIGVNNIINGLNKIDHMNIMICLETMAGKGSELGTNLNELKTIIDSVNYELGVCLDTCHLNDSGYDLNDFDLYLESFDNLIGLDKIKCVHINDSKNIKGSHKDRHENIGLGEIGFDNLIKIIYNDKLKDVPKILETPYVSCSNGDKIPPYKEEIKMIKSKKFNSNLLNDICYK